MFLHIGENISIYKGDIVAILDKKTLFKSEKDRGFIDSLKRHRPLVDEASIKTYIVAFDREREDYSLYTSSISSITLLNRK